jgi:hypothetical protein
MPANGSAQCGPSSAPSGTAEAADAEADALEDHIATVNANARAALREQAARLSIIDFLLVR